MKLHSLIIDEFLSDFDHWRAWADKAEYADVVNPADGVSYPGICTKVPTWGIRNRLQGIMGSQVRIKTAFLRLSTQGVHVPHQAHHDGIMGDYSLMLYLNRPEHCRGGTELVRHLVDDELWSIDHSNPDRWGVYSRCEMRSNRAFLFDAHLMHRASPVGGFGQDARNGRLVYTAFFNLE